ncbi:MAG: GNAT family N-acetyltransferase [Candidatus Kariarchaeaceae archaeon]|jgi:RimJ/RimL family protein N-acetyltransferase
MVSISDAFVGTQVEHDGLKLYPMEFSDIEDMGSWPRFETEDLAWANFPVQTAELRKRWFVQQQKDHLVWIIIRNELGQLVGRSSLTQPLSGSSLIFGLVIRPDLMGQGLGTKITRIMISYIFTVTTLEDVSDIWLESRYNNIRAQKTWERVGFVPIGEHMRREIFGRYDRYRGYTFDRKLFDDSFPVLEVVYRD